MQTPQIGPGHNLPAFDAAVQRLDRCGFLLARLETLMKAVRDRRLNRTCLRVLAVLVETMDQASYTTWIDRGAISKTLEVEPKTVANSIYQLKGLGYIVSERRPTPQANNKVLLHYTLSALSPEEIEAAITHAVQQIEIGVPRGPHLAYDSGQKTAQPDGQIEAEVPSGEGKTEQKCPAGRANDVPAMTGNAQPDGQETAQHDGQSASRAYTRTHAQKESPSGMSPVVEGKGGVGERGSATPRAKPKAKRTLLEQGWRLPRPWGVWAMDHFAVSVNDVRREAALFRDYWHARGDVAAARMADWELAWKNWMRRTRYKVRKAEPDAADLVTEAERGPTLEEKLAARRRADGIKD